MGPPDKDKWRLGEAANRDFYIPDLCGPRAVFFLVLLSELVVLAYVLALGGLLHFDWARFASGSLMTQWIVLSSALVLCLARQPFSRLSLPLSTVASLAVVLLVTAAVSGATMTWLPQFARPESGGWWLLRNLLLAFILAGITLRYFYLQQQLRVQEKLELQSRLDSLRARIRPHFLFNTLNSIASLIASRPDVAEQAVEDLAELFRASLQESAEGASVADELRLCRLYLEIEKLRLGERLQVLWEVDPAVEDAAMPSLFLQPLVENAVYHGVARLPEGGGIRIALARRGERVSVVVENPLAPSAAEHAGNRMALENVSLRLRAIFGADASIAVARENGQFRVELDYNPEQAL